MKRKVITKKVTGGKLFRLDIDYNSRKIDNVKITGDFFMHPENTLIHIEEVLKDISINSEENRIVDLTNIVLKTYRTELIGFTAIDLAKAISEVNEK